MNHLVYIIFFEFRQHFFFFLTNYGCLDLYVHSTLCMLRKFRTLNKVIIVIIVFKFTKKLCGTFPTSHPTMFNFQFILYFQHIFFDRKCMVFRICWFILTCSCLLCELFTLVDDFPFFKFKEPNFSMSLTWKRKTILYLYEPSVHK
jgi:hypothetical protein